MANVKARGLRVGVASDLLGPAPDSGHAKVWRRVLGALSEQTPVVAIDPRSGRPTSRLARRPQVLVADGHADLPPAAAPLVVAVHEAGWLAPTTRELLDPSFHRYIASRTQVAVSAAAHVIVPSESSRRDVARGYGLSPECVHAVPYAADATFSPGARGGRALVARARGGRDAPYVLYAATLHPRKNLEALRMAVASLARAGLPHVLAVAGGPALDRPDSSALERAAAAELPGAPGRIVTLGRPDDDDLAALMAEADAFCLPSLYEGFGLTALEAMACGAPVVVSNRGSLPEVVGDAGLVVDPTADAVAGALRRVLLDGELSDRLRRAGAERAREFTWRGTAGGWLAVLRRAAARV